MSTISFCTQTTACSSHKRKQSSKEEPLIENLFIKLNLNEEFDESVQSNYFSDDILNEE